MHIMTENGWQILKPKVYQAPGLGYALRPWDANYNRNQDPRYNLTLKVEPFDPFAHVAAHGIPARYTGEWRVLEGVRMTLICYNEIMHFRNEQERARKARTAMLGF